MGTFPGSMQKRRYYPTVLQLPEDDIIVLGGDYEVSELPQTIEVFDPASDSWVSVPASQDDFSDEPFCNVLYPTAHLLPGEGSSRGTIFVTGPYDYELATNPVQYNCDVGGTLKEVRTQRFDLPSTPSDFSAPWQAGPVPDISHGQPGGTPGALPERIENGSVVVVDCTSGTAKSRVIIAGGHRIFDNLQLTGNTQSIDDPQLAGAQWENVDALEDARWDASFELLPGQRLLALGGRKPSTTFPLLTPEILELTADPLTPEGKWATLADHQIKRQYHSWALLLPDARVLLAGGENTEQFPEDYRHAEIFTPPYAYHGIRPTLHRATPSRVHYGETHTIKVQSIVGNGNFAFELIRPGAMTHTVDFSQRLIELEVDPDGDPDPKAFGVTWPPGPDVAPPGWYMLFAISSDGVPSVAKFVHIEEAP